MIQAMHEAEPGKLWYGADLQQRKTWYTDVAEAYHRVRPRYPQQLIERAIEVAQLPADATILEVGCGPGTATTAFAQLGFSMLCLEPNPAAYQLARQNCATYSTVQIVNTSFEEWELEPEQFDAVLAATSFHWIPAEIGYPKAAAALQPHGFLILLWSKEPQPTQEIYEAMHEVYRAEAPSLARYEDQKTQTEALQRVAQPLLASDRFQPYVFDQITCEITYSIPDYLLLLSTLSPYIALEPPKRTALFEALSSALEKTTGGSIACSYLSAFHIAQRIAEPA